MKRTVFAALIIASAAAFAAFACDDERPVGVIAEDAGEKFEDAAADVDAQDAQVEDAEPTCKLPGRYGSAECERCLKIRCCQVIQDCEADLNCKPLNRCNLACRSNPDAGGCRVGCVDQFPLGEQKLKAIDACGIAEDPAGCRESCATSGQ